MLSDLRYRLRAIFRRGAVERELDHELRFHLDQHIAKEMHAGASRDEAERRARLLFGGVDQMKEASRDARGVSPLEIVIRDLRYAVRLLAKSPGFTLVAIVSLTLGIGANTAMFQLLNALVLRSLPIAQPEAIVEIRPVMPDNGPRGSFSRFPAFTNPLWEHLREQQDAFSSLFAWGGDSFNLAPSGEARRVRGLWVSGSFFPALGVTPVLGRLFSPPDDHRGCGLPGAVISYDFWQREFGADASAIGRTITVNASRIDIIGVTPPGFFGLEVGRTFDVALPICSMTALRPGADQLNNGMSWWLIVMGRLKPGWTPERAEAQLRGISSALFAASLPANYPPVSVKPYLASTLSVVPAGTGLSGLRERYASPITLLLAMTGLVLLIACANLANLMITRGTLRSRELALRLALGASRLRLISQLLSESLLIAIVSAGAGLLVARTLSQSLIVLLSTPTNPIVLGIGLDWRVFGFTSGTAVLTCLFLGLAPALRATRGSPGDVLKGSRGVTRDHESLGLRRTLLVAQVAVSLVLVVAALLFVRSFRNLANVPLGFQQEGVLLVDADLPRPLPSPESLLAMKRDLLERLRTLPGVQGVAQTSVVPLSGNSTSNSVWMDGGGPARGISCSLSDVSPGYFQTMGIPLLAGRDITERDTPTSPPVAVVNESFARAFVSGRNPVGSRFWIETTPNSPQTLFEIVGMVRDSKYRDVREDPRPVAFLALDRRPPPGVGGTIVLRSTAAPDALAAGVREALRAANPNLRFTLRVFDSQIRETLVRERVMAALSALFGLLAGLLAAIGLHGIITYTVERRRREIGIRLALGASRATIVKSVLEESGKWVAVGLTVGVLVSLALTRTAQTLLFGVQPGDPATIAIGAAGLALVALLASYLPAQRAARVDPMTTLKDD
jgi:putative ABC transport system permease protein